MTLQKQNGESHKQWADRVTASAIGFPSRQRYEHEVEIEHLRTALLIMTCVALSLAVLYSVGVYERRDMICTKVAPRHVER